MTSLLKRFILIVLVVLLVLFSSCKRRYKPSLDRSPKQGLEGLTNLPEPVRQEHQDANFMFKVTWFQRPFSKYFDILLADPDGYVGHWLAPFARTPTQANSGQLDKKQRQEIRSILQRLTQRSAPEEVNGRRVVTIDFVWDGQGYILSFDEVGCPDGLYRLFEITEVTFKKYPHVSDFSIPCQDGPELRETPNPANLDSISVVPADLPDYVRESHTARLITLTWFQEPFTGRYEVLTVHTNNSVFHKRQSVEGEGKLFEGQLTDAEKQKIQAIMGWAASLDIIESSSEDGVQGKSINLSFTWNADFQFRSFPNSKCPDPLHSLFEIARTALKRSYSGDDVFTNPCES